MNQEKINYENIEKKIRELTSNIQYLEDKSLEIKNSTDEYARVFREELKEIAKDGRSKTALSRQEKTIKALIKDREDVQEIIDSNFEEIKASMDRFENRLNKNLNSKLGIDEYENDSWDVKKRIDILEKGISGGAISNLSKDKKIENSVDEKDFKQLYKRIDFIEKELKNTSKIKETEGIDLTIDEVNKDLKKQIEKLKAQIENKFEKIEDKASRAILENNNKIKDIEKIISKNNYEKLDEKIESLKLTAGDKFKEANVLNQNVLNNYTKKINDSLKAEIKSEIEKLDYKNTKERIENKISKLEENLDSKIEQIDLDNEQLLIKKRIDKLEKSLSNINDERLIKVKEIEDKISNDEVKKIGDKFKEINEYIDNKIKDNNELNQSILTNYGKKLNDNYKKEIKTEIENTNKSVVIKLNDLETGLKNKVEKENFENELNKLKNEFDKNNIEKTNKLNLIEEKVIKQDYDEVNKKIQDVQSQLNNKMEEVNVLSQNIINNYGKKLKDSLNLKLQEEVKKLDYDNDIKNILININDLKAALDTKIEKTDFEIIENKYKEEQKSGFEDIRKNLVEKLAELNVKVDGKIDETDYDILNSKISELESNMKNESTNNGYKISEFQTEMKKYINNVVKRVNFNSDSIEKVHDELEDNKLQIKKLVDTNNDQIKNLERKIKTEFKDKIDKLDLKSLNVIVNAIEKEITEIKKNNSKNEEKYKYFNAQLKNIMANQQLLENRIVDLQSKNNTTQIESMVNAKLKTMQNHYEKLLNDKIIAVQNNVTKQLESGMRAQRTNSRGLIGSRQQDLNGGFVMGKPESDGFGGNYSNIYSKNKLQGGQTSKSAAGSIDNPYNNRGRKPNMYDDGFNTSSYSNYGTQNGKSSMFSSRYLDDFDFDDDDDEF